MPNPSYPPRSARYAVQTSILLWSYDDLGSRGIPAETINVSRSGLCVRAHFEKPVGSRLRFEMRLPVPDGGRSCVIEGWGRVIRREPAVGNMEVITSTIQRCVMRS